MLYHIACAKLGIELYNKVHQALGSTTAPFRFYRWAHNRDVAQTMAEYADVLLRGADVIAAKQEAYKEMDFKWTADAVIAYIGLYGGLPLDNQAIKSLIQWRR